MRRATTILLLLTLLTACGHPEPADVGTSSTDESTDGGPEQYMLADLGNDESATETTTTSTTETSSTETTGFDACVQVGYYDEHGEPVLCCCFMTGPHDEWCPEHLAACEAM
jgi:hypothetical protein